MTVSDGQSPTRMRTHASKSGCLLLLAAVLGYVSTAFLHAGFFYPGNASNTVPWPDGVIPYVSL